jgi:hypothetical protein
MPSGLALFGISFVVLLTFVLLLWAVNVLPGKVRAWWNMSSTGVESTSKETVAERLPATSTDSGQRIAMQGNAVNTELPGNLLPEAAREIIRYQQRVEDAVKIIQSGRVGQTEVIELVFNCKRSGRADSPYAKARAAVQAQLGPARPEYVGDMIERVQREVAAEQR